MAETVARLSHQPGSPWSPFASKPFAVLWAATLLSNVGTWMHDVAAGWLMTSLAPSALMVSLVQTATTLPIFLLALPAGALADILDRRHILICVNVAMALLAASLGWLVMQGHASAIALLAFTFALGICTALIAPAWQAIVPQLVPRERLAAAIALNSLGINVSRAIGPALGAVLIVSVGIAWPFVANAISFVCVILALRWWRRAPTAHSAAQPERFGRAAWAGLRFARASPPLRATLLRALAFFSCASAYWALLPLIARTRLSGDAQVYGVLVACIGAGAVAGAILLPKVRGQLGFGRTANLGVLATAFALIGFAIADTRMAAVVASTLSGLAWITVLSSLNISAQAVLPEWVRARGLAVYNACFFGAMAAGSLVWGQAAELFGIPVALMTAALLSLLGLIVSLRWRLHETGELDLSPALAWANPSGAIAAESGPVLTTVEYMIEPAFAGEFLDRIRALADARRRNGAFEWSVYRDARRPERIVEQFFEHSWSEHLRHHERMTNEDRALQLRVHELHRSDAPPHVTHFVAADAK